MCVKIRLRISKPDSIFVSRYRIRVFISIHLNKFEQSRYFGAQVFYGEKNAQSKAIAESIQEALKSGIANGNHRVAKPAGDSIYLMRTLTYARHSLWNVGSYPIPRTRRSAGAGYLSDTACSVYSGRVLAGIEKRYLAFWGGTNETENSLFMQ